MIIKEISKIEAPKEINVLKIYQDDLSRNPIEDWEHGININNNFVLKT